MKKINLILLVKYKEHDLIIIQINVDGILVGATNKSLCKEFENYMHKAFKINIICLDGKDKRFQENYMHKEF
jgi:hypothetical protein